VTKGVLLSIRIKFEGYMYLRICSVAFYSSVENIGYCQHHINSSQVEKTLTSKERCEN
jgi:hypothetical protein